VIRDASDAHKTRRVTDDAISGLFVFLRELHQLLAQAPLHRADLIDTTDTIHCDRMKRLTLRCSMLVLLSSLYAIAWVNVCTSSYNSTNTFRNELYYSKLNFKWQTGVTRRHLGYTGDVRVYAHASMRGFSLL